jgi:fluoride exporter
VLAVIALGGAIGAVSRYGIEVAWPTSARGFPGATLLVNTSGCALIGILMVLVNDVWPERRLVRPFLGTGVLGGFTTFSTYAVEVERLLTAGAARTGLLYLAITPVAALVAVWAATLATRRAIRRRTLLINRQSARSWRG